MAGTDSKWINLKFSLSSEMSKPNFYFCVISLMTDCSDDSVPLNMEIFICNKWTSVLTWLFTEGMAILAGITAGPRPAHTGTHTVSEQSHAIVLTRSAVTRTLLLQIGLQCPLEVEFLQPGTWHLFDQFIQWPQLGIWHHIMNAFILTLYFYAHVLMS